MWPFNKKKQKQTQLKDKIQTLVMIRYTYDVWQKLFPTLTKEQWEELNCPDNVSEFLKQSIKRSSTAKQSDGSCRLPDFKDALIATLDNKYLYWLETNALKHTQENLGKYLEVNMNNPDYWDQCLFDSEMTTIYNVMGIPFSMLVHDLNGRKISEYSLKDESTKEIEPILAEIYESEEVFVPGWIVRGADMPKCVSHIVEFAKIYLQKNKKVRYGRFLEQTYTDEELKDLFKPYNYLIPFVVKKQINKSLISFQYYDKDSNIAHDLIRIKFKEEEKEKIKNILTADDPHVISVGNSAMMPGQAYLINAMKMPLTNN